jgi:hypothetical protein
MAAIGVGVKDSVSIVPFDNVPISGTTLCPELPRLDEMTSFPTVELFSFASGGLAISFDLQSWCIRWLGYYDVDFGIVERDDCYPCSSFHWRLNYEEGVQIGRAIVDLPSLPHNPQFNAG